MICSVLIACRLLYELIHVTEMQLIRFGSMKGKSGKETVLIKIIIHDLFAEIYMDLII